jgi:diguanylate cyclase (GGDEF)-like protein
MRVHQWSDDKDQAKAFRPPAESILDMQRFQPSPRSRSESELVIQRLYEITSHYDAGFEAQVKDLLRMGCERFGLDIGILSKINDRRYEVVQAVAPDGIELSAGDQFPLGDTYCCITLEADGPVGFEHVAHSDVSSHPAYSAFGLEAYVGTPVRVRGELYGTLNFSSVSPLPRKFRDVDIECLMVMKGWLEGEIQRRNVERELAEAMRRYEELSRIDPLTETRNRRGLSEFLERMSARGAYDGTAIGVVLVDLDDFKTINDTFGHSVGDLVIQETAKSIAAAIRPTDVLGRIGGDEFLALLPACATDADCRTVAERIRDVVAAQAVPMRERVARVTCSIGAALMQPEQLSVTDVLIEVEGLLRQSKLSGKNRFMLATAQGTEQDTGFSRAS